MRMIDADALQNILLIIATALEHEYGSLGGAVSGCMKHIDNAPTIDAAPVVRCEKCVAHGNCFAERVFVYTGIENPYCCAGERKDGGENG